MISGIHLAPGVRTIISSRLYPDFLLHFPRSPLSVCPSVATDMSSLRYRLREPCSPVHLSLWFILARAVLSDKACYWPNGGKADDFLVECKVNVGSSLNWTPDSCCGQGDVCLYNGACYDPQSEYGYRGACIQQDWADDSDCPLFCNSVHSNWDMASYVSPCLSEPGWWYCEDDPPPKSTLCKDWKWAFEMPGKDFASRPSHFVAGIVVTDQSIIRRLVGGFQRIRILGRTTARVEEVVVLFRRPNIKDHHNCVTAIYIHQQSSHINIWNPGSDKIPPAFRRRIYKLQGKGSIIGGIERDTELGRVEALGRGDRRPEHRPAPDKHHPRGRGVAWVPDHDPGVRPRLRVRTETAPQQACSGRDATAVTTATPGGQRCGV